MARVQRVHVGVQEADQQQLGRKTAGTRKKGKRKGKAVSRVGPARNQEKLPSAHIPKLSRATSDEIRSKWIRPGNRILREYQRFQSEVLGWQWAIPPHAPLENDMDPGFVAQPRL